MYGSCRRVVFGFELIACILNPSTKKDEFCKMYHHLPFFVHCTVGDYFDVPAYSPALLAEWSKACTERQTGTFSCR